MALEGEEQEVSPLELSDFSDLSHDELLEAFIELVHDFTSLAKKLNIIKSMHKNMYEKYKESSNIILTLKIEKSLLTSKLNEMSSNTIDHTKKTIS